MALRDLRIFPDPLLRERCRKIEDVDDEVIQLLDDLAESMYANKGLGLAAPQIGAALRAVVVDVEQRDGIPRLVELVNPEVIESSNELSDFEEGCLSFPGEAEKVIRPAKVTVRALDRDGKLIEVKTDGLLATAIQHEIDHLDGVLFIDHVSRLKRSLVKRRMKKKARPTVTVGDRC
ncbi:MAG TPA: peptide deformylase [Myxococcota bacterium]|nr:peptide deformylase [Myxococcota bacterium]